MDVMQIDVMVADASHEVYVDTILDTIREAAKKRGTGIAERTHEYVATKMKEGKAIIALNGDEFAGFTYIESWGNKQYVATSGLIVHPKYQGIGLAKRIKQASFRLARLRWPWAKIFSLTSGAAEHRAGLRARHLQRTDRRRGVLEGLRRLHQPRYPGGQEPQVLHLHGDAVRPGVARGGQNLNEE